MQESLLEILRCPVTKSKLSLKIIRRVDKILDGQPVSSIEEGILYAEHDWFFPVVKGIPRLLVEAIMDYEDFLQQHLPDFDERKKLLFSSYGTLIKLVHNKNKRTKKSFEKEWTLFNYDKDKIWDADQQSILPRFLQETDETIESIQQKLIFDAGCGNGLLNILLAEQGITNIAMDLCNGIDKAYAKNNYSKLHFIQGDVQFPPVAFRCFDIVQCSGVLIHTNNTELSFSCIEPVVKYGGKLSVWLYHKRKNFIHNLFNTIRAFTSKLPLKLQYYLYIVTLFPASYVVKRIKGNKQNTREMMIDILDWFTPEFRWEHDEKEVTAWFSKRKYTHVKTTARSIFGFNMTGVKTK